MRDEATFANEQLTENVEFMDETDSARARAKEKEDEENYLYALQFTREWRDDCGRSVPGNDSDPEWPSFDDPAEATHVPYTDVTSALAPGVHSDLQAYQCASPGQSVLAPGVPCGPLAATHESVTTTTSGAFNQTSLQPSSEHRASLADDAARPRESNEMGRRDDAPIAGNAQNDPQENVLAPGVHSAQLANHHVEPGESVLAPGVSSIPPGVSTGIQAPPPSPKPQRVRREQRKRRLKDARTIDERDSRLPPTLYSSACMEGSKHTDALREMRTDSKFQAPLCIPEPEWNRGRRYSAPNFRLLVVASNDRPAEGRKLRDATRGLLRNRYTPQQIRAAQERDPDLRLIIDIMENHADDPEQIRIKLQDATKAVSRFWRKKGERLYFAQFKVLVKSTKPKEERPPLIYPPAIVLPMEYRMIVLHFVHDRSGHHGHDKTLHTLRERFDWPTMHSDVIRYINTCDTCQKTKNPMGRVKHLLRNIVTGRPNECVQIDHLKLPKTHRGHIGLLVMIDHFSKYLEAAPCLEMTAEETARLLDQFWFSRWGTPAFIQSDNGSQFTSKLFEEFLAMSEVAHVLSAPYHPRSNGLVERANRSIIATLSLQCSTKQQEWDDYIQKAVFAHNCTVQATTRVTPNALFTGGNKTLPLGSVFPNFSPEFRGSPHELVRQHQRAMQHFLAIARANTEQQQIRQKRLYDARLRKAFKYKTGDVIVTFVPVISKDNSKKLTRMWRGPFVVRHVSEDGMSVYTDDGKMYNYENCRPYSMRPHDFVVDDKDNICTRPWKPEETEDIVLPNEIDPADCVTDDASRASVMNAPLPPPEPLRMRLRNREAMPRPKYAESPLSDLCERICSIDTGEEYQPLVHELDLDDDLTSYESSGDEQGTETSRLNMEQQEPSSDARSTISREPDIMENSFVTRVDDDFDLLRMDIEYMDEPGRVPFNEALADDIYEFVLQTLEDVPTVELIPPQDIRAFWLPPQPLDDTQQWRPPVVEKQLSNGAERGYDSNAHEWDELIDSLGDHLSRIRDPAQPAQTTAPVEEAADIELQKEQSNEQHDRLPIVPIDDPLNRPRPLAEPVCVARTQFFLTDEWRDKLERMKKMVMRNEWPFKRAKRLAHLFDTTYCAGDFLQADAPGVIPVPANFEMRTNLRRQLLYLLKPGALDYLFQHRRGAGKAILLPPGYTNDEHDYARTKRWYFLLVKTKHEEEVALRTISDSIADLAYIVDTHKDKRLSVLMIKEAWEWISPYAIASLFQVAFEGTGVQFDYYAYFVG